MAYNALKKDFFEMPMIEMNGQNILSGRAPLHSIKVKEVITYCEYIPI